jgi:CobQ-like glutamine amidotransferase family enzyme
MRYRVLVCGSNVLVGDELRKAHGSELKNVSVLGFATTRFVGAPNLEEACKVAIEAARQELRGLMANHPSNSPTFEIEEVRELGDDDLEKGPNAGFTFFRER